MTHGKMVITAQVETFNNLNQYNLIIKCRWLGLLCIVHLPQKYKSIFWGPRFSSQFDRISIQVTVSA